jgi:hypothetical protein
MKRIAERSDVAPDRGVSRPWRRVPLLAGGAIALILGIAGGLQRLGWNVAGGGASLADLHGPLMPICTGR